MDRIIDSLDKATIFPTLDAKSKYWQVETDNTDLEITARTSQHGLF